MINEVVLEGIVVKTWKYADELLFRVACCRDPDLPHKPYSMYASELSSADRLSQLPHK
jgi:hypothetical protein